MSEYLGEDVGKNILDAYASASRKSHQISVTRFIGVLAATQDRRLLELIAGMFGWAVVEKRHLRLINIAAIEEKQAELARAAKVQRRLARREGVL